MSYQYKFIQIAVSGEVVFALDVNGDVWMYKTYMRVPSWERLSQTRDPLE